MTPVVEETVAAAPECRPRARDHRRRARSPRPPARPRQRHARVVDARRAGAHARAADLADLEHAAARRRARPAADRARRRPRGRAPCRRAARGALRTAARRSCRSPRSPRCRSGSRSRPAGRRRTCSSRSTSSSPRARWPGPCRACATRRRSTRRGANGALEWLLAGSVVLYALQSSYSRSVDIALEQTVFFYVPFALLFALLREVEWSPRRLRAGLLVLVGARARVRRRRLRRVRDALAAAQPEGDRLQRARGVLPGQLALLRPEHLRPLPLARDARARRGAALGAAAARRAARGRSCWPCSGAASCSRSRSRASPGCCAGLFVLAALRFPVRRVAAARPRGGDRRARRRARLPVRAAARPGRRGVARRRDVRPLRADPRRGRPRARPAADRLGLGRVRARPTSTRASARARDAVSASHTIPLTVTAEQGIVGLARLRRAAGRGARAGCSRGARGDPYRAVVAAGFVAVVVHTWLYAAFLEDPVTWTLLAVGTSLAAARRASGARDTPAAVPAASA